MLKCNIISFDYSGYGLSNGSPIQNEIISDYETIIGFCKNFLNIPLNNLILMGQSLGNVPLLYFCTNFNIKKIKGSILISPISFYEYNVNSKKKKNAFYKDNISQLLCPIFIIHGKKDNIISINHSIELSKYIRNLCKWFPKKGTNNNIIAEYRYKFYQKIKFFVNIKCNCLNNEDSMSQMNSFKTSFTNSEINSKIINYYNYNNQREENYIEDEEQNINKNIKNKSINEYSNYTIMRNNDTFNYDISEMSYNY